MMRRFILLSAGLFLTGLMPAAAQFAPQAGIAGSTAIPASSVSFLAWATHCTLRRGLQQAGNVAGGYASSGDSTAALGAPNGNVVSLGDSGVAVVTFAQPVTNGAGPDFAVFENGFPNPQNSEEAFLELAFVEVSSDGQRFVRFPATSLTPEAPQMSSTAGSTYGNARLLNNLAGKYISNYGTPFDLQELADSSGLDIHHITHIRIVDCIGDVGAHATLDAYGHKVNDPFPTPFPTGGFDLDAVGVIHQAGTGISSTVPAERLAFYPNPADNLVHIVLPCESAFYRLVDLAGHVITDGLLRPAASDLQLEHLPSGYYFIYLTDTATGTVWTGKLFRQ